MLLYFAWKAFSFVAIDHWAMKNVEMYFLPLLNIAFHPRNHSPLTPMFLDEQLFFLAIVKRRQSKTHPNYPSTTIPLPWTAAFRSFSMFDDETLFPESLDRAWSSRETIKHVSYRWMLQYDGKLLFDDPVLGCGIGRWPGAKHEKEINKRFFTTSALPSTWTAEITWRKCRDLLIDSFILFSSLLTLLVDVVRMWITILSVVRCIHIKNLDLLGTNIFWSYKQRSLSHLTTTKTYRTIPPSHVLVYDYSNQFWRLSCRSV